MVLTLFFYVTHTPTRLKLNIYRLLCRTFFFFFFFFTKITNNEKNQTTESGLGEKKRGITMKYE